MCADWLGAHNGRVKSTALLPTLEVARLSTTPDFASLLHRLQGRRSLLALDSAAGEPGNWSWIAFDPRQDLAPLPSSLAGLRAYLRADAPCRETSLPGPFQGGFMGALAYDLGVHGEDQDLPEDPWCLPPIVGGFYTDFFVFDHRAQQAYLVTSAERSACERKALLDLAAECRGPQEVQRASGINHPLERRVSSVEHCARVERARQEIALGEYYQANLAHPFETETNRNPLDIYLDLRRVNPAPYMAYLRFEEGALLSASPELLLDVHAGKLLARPIKGTEARSPDPLEDTRLGKQLLASVKDRAELAMIVDLMRNDLGRVARIGSVQVDAFPQLRSYAGVHHLMADVRADLARDRDALDALLAVFPGGSITGAPKLRSMLAIGQLETEGRGYFTGSAGFLDTQGNACFNILIRTIQWRPKRAGVEASGCARFHVGGGITWSSQPQAEDRETLIKGARLAQALGFKLDTSGILEPTAMNS
ncbi:MAG: para-aminobenzoate synthetase component 1 [Candidatus Paceibacteria bacterium]